MGEGRTRRRIETREDIVAENNRLLMRSALLLPILGFLFALPYLLETTACPSSNVRFEVRMASGIAATQYCAYDTQGDMGYDFPQLVEASMCGSDLIDAQLRAEDAMQLLSAKVTQCRAGIRRFYELSYWFR